MAKRSAKRSKRPGKPAGKSSGKSPRKTAKKPSSRGPVKPKRSPRPRPTAAKTAATSNASGERLQKVLAAAGVASRRECELLIAEGRVQVDGEVVTELGVRVDPFKATIRVDGEALKKTRPVYFAVNKPTGVVCTARDPAGRPRVTDLLPPDVGRVFNVGRLDMASEGLILVTNDGELANQLTHPRHGVEKLYQVQVAGMPTKEALDKVRRGVFLDEGRVAFSNVKVKSRRKNSTILEVILDEGRNREIRRVLARVGHKVQKLKRVAVGPVRLGETPAGGYRALTRDEVKALRSAATSIAAKDASAVATRPRPARGKPKAASERASAKPRGAAKPKATGGSSARRVIGADAEPAPAKKKASPRRKPAGKGSDRRGKRAGARK